MSKPSSLSDFPQEIVDSYGLGVGRPSLGLKKGAADVAFGKVELRQWLDADRFCAVRVEGIHFFRELRRREATGSGKVRAIWPPDARDGT